MKRIVWLVAASLSFLALSCGAPPEGEPESAPGSGLLGRWDISVIAIDRYPLWLELTDGGGRLQPRGGHALPLEELSIDGGTASFRVGETEYEASLDGERLRGVGRTESGEFEWVGVRAPELPAVENPQWSEPVELFDGEDLTGWIPQKGDAENLWRAENGELVNAGSGANLMTEAKFDDFQLHIEVNVPEGSNSGIYLRGRHEIQVQDDHGKEPFSRHMGGIYGQVTPTSNPALPAGEWQSFDVTLLGRWVTVVLNGTTIIDHQEIPGITGGALDANEAQPGPILLQGDHGPVKYRNIVLTPRSP